MGAAGAGLATAGDLRTQIRRSAARAGGESGGWAICGGRWWLVLPTLCRRNAEDSATAAPSSTERTAIAKAPAIWLAEKAIAASEVIAKSSWLYHSIPSISSYLDAPRSLGELQEDLTSKPGDDVHHIVEQSSAEADNYPRRMIDASDNLVRIPRMKHWEINAWSQTPNELYGDVPPREYLRGKDWGERRRVGLYALQKFGVLRP